MTTELTKAAQQALEVLKTYREAYNQAWVPGMDILEPDGDKAIDELESALTQRPAALQPGASNEATTQAQDDSSGDAQVDQGRVRDADSRVGSTVPELTQRPAAQTEREAFEAWYCENVNRAVLPDYLPKLETYSSATVANLFSSWKAGAAWLRASMPAPQPDEDDDGDVTGQPGPLPETGWDEVPAGAFRKPSPTAGMNLGERIKHVGGRENTAGYIEFGSVMAVRALVRQYLRDLPAPQQATSHVETDWISNVIRDVSELPDRSSPDDEPDMMLVTAAELRSILETHAPQQATPAQDGTRSPHDGEPMSARKAAYFMQRFRREEKLLGPNEQLAINFVLAMLEAQQATPEPVGEPVAWQRRDRNIVTGEWSEWHEDDDIEEELDPEWAERRPLFTRPAPVETEPVGEPVALWIDLKDGDTVQLGDRLMSEGRWRTVDEESQLVGREYHAKHWWPMQRLATRPAPGVPEGFALVSVEPTDEIRQAFFSDLSGAAYSYFDDDSDPSGGFPQAWRNAIAASQAKGGEHG